LLEAIDGCKKVLIVDETRRTGGISEALMTLLAEHSRCAVRRIAAEDSFIATGPAYGATMPSTASIIEAARAFVKEPAT